MKLSGIIHQQICQLKWHLLACFGLIMVLPIEEAIVDLRAGDDYLSSAMASLAVMFSPLLAGLIACANVQGDLNEKHYIFWRSKPANVKLLITHKYFIGLVASLLIIACPVIFVILCSIIWNSEGFDRFVPLPILIAIMAYSLCFACNVVVRKTARAWLIGMLIGCFVLVLPFMLPLNLKDFMTDVMLLTFGLYLTIILVVSAAAFVFALYAAQHDWCLKTNLRELLWVGTGLVFILLMLFSSQVANIKVLCEREIDAVGTNELAYLGNRVILKGRSYIDVDNNKISLSHVVPDPDTGLACLAGGGISFGRKDYIPSIYPDPWCGGLYKKVGDDVYSFVIWAYTPDHGKSQSYEKVYLRSCRFSKDPQPPASELDISDCLTNGTTMNRIAARLIDNTLIVCVNDSLIVVDVTDPSELRQIYKKLGVLKHGFRNLENEYRQKVFTAPLVPVDNINIEERIRLSVDLRYRFHYDNHIYESSIVDIHDGKIAFFSVSQEDVARFDVTSWDDEKIYCRFSAARPFTILEGMAGTPGRNDRIFVKDQKLYCYEDEQLMVFDVSSERRIRKLGHYVRMDCNIEDIAVLEDGQILLSNRWHKPSGKNRLRDRRYLYLLEKPE
jgi:hypothetical protein